MSPRTLPRGIQRLTNPGFESGDTGWAIDDINFFIDNDAATARSGSWRCRYQSNGAGGPNLLALDEIPVRPGDRVYCAAWTRTPSGTGTSGLATRWRDSAGVLSGRTLVTGTNTTVTGPLANWVLMEGISDPAPANAVALVFDWGENTADNSATPWYIDDCEFRLATSADEERLESVHLIELSFSGGLIRMNTGAQDLVTEPYGVRIGASATRYLLRNPVTSQWPASALSIEFWGRLDTDAETQDSNWAFSYARQTVQFNEILFGIEVTSGLMFLSCFINGSGVADADAYPDDNAWHHCVLTWDSASGTVKMYKDGVLVHEVSGIQTGYTIAAGGVVVLGQDQDSAGGGFASTQAWKGELDEVRVYKDRVLTPTEVAEHYARRFLDETNLVAYWGFDRRDDLGRDASSGGNHLVTTGITSPEPGAPAVVRTWEAIGGNLTFGGVEGSPDQGSQGIDLLLTGVDQTILAALLTNDFRGRPVKVYRTHWESASGLLLAEPILLFEGVQLGAYEAREEATRGGGSVAIKTRVLGQMGLQRIRGIWTNQVSHQHIFSGDTFFQFTTQLSNQKVYWGTPVPRTIGTRRDPRQQR